MDRTGVAVTVTMVPVPQDPAEQLNADDLDRSPAWWRRWRGPSWVAPLAVWTAVMFWAVQAAASIFAALSGLIVLLGVSLFVSFAMEPVVGRLARRGWRRGPAALLVLVVTAVTLGGMVVGVGAVLVAQGIELLDDLPTIVEDASTWMHSTFGVKLRTDGLVEPGGPLDNLSQRLGARLSEDALAVGGQVGAVVGKLFTVGLFSFYLSADGPKFRRLVCRFAPQHRQQHVLLLFEVAIEKAGGYMLSRFVLAGISTVVHAAAFTAIGVPYPLPLALWMGVVSQMVPVVGTYLAAAAPLILSLTGSPGVAVGAAAVIVIYQQVENMIIAPRVVGSTVDIHPLVAFASVIAGMSLLGPLGALVGIPIAATLQEFAATFWSGHDLADSHEGHDLLAEPAARQRRWWRGQR